MLAPFVFIIDGIWRKPGRFVRWQKELAALGVESVEHDYNSSGRISIAELGLVVAQQIRELDRPVRLLGFSMGGLIARAAKWCDPSLPVERAAFMNTPHRGSWLAYAPLPLAAVRQMRPTSVFIRELNEMPWDVPTMAVHSPGDAMVLPGTNARFAGAAHSICNKVPAHMWPVYSPSIRRRVIEFLSESDATATIVSYRNA